MIGRRAASFYVDPNQRSGFLNELRAAGQVNNFEVNLATASGRQIWVLISAHRIEFDGQEAFTVAFNDISSRKSAEEQLRMSEERYRMLAENSNDTIWTMDMQGRFTYVSPAVQQLRNYTPEEVLQQAMEEAVCPGSVPLLRESMQQAVEAAQTGRILPPAYLEIEQPCKGGDTVWTEATARLLLDGVGKPVGFIGVSRDISERKRLQQEIQNTMTDLTVFNQAMVGREIRMIELKREVNGLLESDGKSPKYVIPQE
jgi:PAS domain S-box-containing protein